MNSFLYFIFLITTFGVFGMDEPPRKYLGRSKTAPMRFPSDHPEKEVAEATQLNDDMQLIAAKRSKSKVDRTITPDTMKLLRLDPHLGHTIDDNTKKLNCQTAILEAIQAFDDAQGAYLELQATAPKTLAQDHDRYDQFTDIEDRQLEALCALVTKYEDGCWDAYPLIASAHRAIMSLECKRRTLNKEIAGLHPKYIEKNFLERVKKINIMENGRKSDNRKSMSLPVGHAPIVDLNKAGELRTRAMKSLQTADTLVKRVLDVPNTDITQIEYLQAEDLYCAGMEVAIESFHTQPNMEERQIIFEDIQTNLKKVQDLQRRQRAQGFSLEISEEYAAICQFIQDNHTDYEVQENQKGKSTWAHALRGTRDAPPPTPHAQPAPAAAQLHSSKLQRFLACITPCVKK